MRKTKHFRDGGADKVDQARYDSYDNSPEEAARKEAGLEATKGQSSGFFGLGRFLEGDIDNPKSEAYKYGAGYKSRNLAPVEDRTPVPVGRNRSRSEAEDDAGYVSDNTYVPSESPETADGRVTKQEAAAARVNPTGPVESENKPPKKPPVKTEVKKTVVPAKPTLNYSNEGRNAKAPASSGTSRTTIPYSKTQPFYEGKSKQPAEYNPEITPAERARLKKMESEQALETSTPEALIVGSGGIAAGAGLKGLFNLAKGAVSKLGSRGAQGSSRLNEYVQPLLPGSKETARRLTGPEEAVADVVAKRLSVSRPAASDNVKEAARKLSERDQRAKNAKTRDVVSDRSSWSAGREGALGNKKGGRIKAYASGGSVSSASSRGDGIAQRGKTRGKMC
jgi:hypothetical protein